MLRQKFNSLALTFLCLTAIILSACSGGGSAAESTKNTPESINITTALLPDNKQVIQGESFVIFAQLQESNISAQTIAIANNTELMQAGILVYSEPATCILQTNTYPYNKSCLFTVVPLWNAAIPGAYEINFVNSGSLNLSQPTISFSLYTPSVYLPQTGESAIFGTPSFTVPYGADGNPAVGLLWPNQRFIHGVNNESQCIIDTLTGLMWLESASLLGAPAWESALAATESMNTTPGAIGYNLCGHTDWRLPNVNELMSLINDGYNGFSSVWLTDAGFISVQHLYLTSSTYAQNTDLALYVDVWLGSIGYSQKTDSGSNFVWPVRGGQHIPAAIPESIALIPQTGESAIIDNYVVPAGGDGNPAYGESWPTPRFIQLSFTGSHCIIDTLTGLMWAESADLFAVSDWSTALAEVESMNTNPTAVGYRLCGYNDWRLPNKRELLSLVNWGSRTNQSEWLISQGFSSVQLYYWSSSTNALDTTQAWNIYLVNGLVSSVSKTSSASATWPVRGGF